MRIPDATENSADPPRSWLKRDRRFDIAATPPAWLGHEPHGIHTLRVDALVRGRLRVARQQGTNAQDAGPAGR